MYQRLYLVDSVAVCSVCCLDQLLCHDFVVRTAGAHSSRMGSCSSLGWRKRSQLEWFQYSVCRFGTGVCNVLMKS